MKVNAEQAYSLVIERLKSHQRNTPFLLVIDGRSASGKTTFASKFGFPVVHTDDFFRPRNREGRLELSEYSGNFDLSRFKTEVADHVNDINGFSYGVFDCKRGEIIETKSIFPCNAIIIEGAYSMHPDLGLSPDMTLFFDISRDKQEERIIKRNGIQALEAFSRIWIPAEERYFEHFNLKYKSEYTVITEL